MVIEPSALIVGDEDGFLCVSPAEVDRIQILASERHDAERLKLRAIADGRNKRPWLVEKLRKLGCQLPQCLHHRFDHRTSSSPINLRHF